MKKIFTVVFLTSCILSQTHGQVYSDKVVGKKNKEYADSIKAKEYPYALPIWGAKVTALGFDILFCP